MSDIEIIYNCVFDKTYQNKVQFKIELEKISDRKLLAGLLMDLSIKCDGYDSDKDEMMQICAEVLSKEELETDYLLDANIYYQNSLSEMNKERLGETRFLLDFYSYLLSDDKVSQELKEKVKEKVADVGPIDIHYLLTNNKQYLPSLKQRMIDSELYEVIPLIDKYL